MAQRRGTLIDLHKLNPDEVLSEDFLPEYNRGMQFLHLELVHLNANIFILDHVLNFPFRIFVPSGRSLFFRYVFENSFYASLLIITRMAADQPSVFFTLPRFRNRVRQAVKVQYRDPFDQLLRDVRFDGQIKAALEKAQALRSRRVAHSAEDMVLDESEEPLVRFGDLKQLRDHLVSVLGAIAFNVHHMMHPVQYSPRVEHPKGTDARSDIEELLDMLAERSPALRLPDDRPEQWRTQREIYSARELDTFNTYRRKFGLPEA